LELDRVYF